MCGLIAIFLAFLLSLHNLEANYKVDNINVQFDENNIHVLSYSDNPSSQPSSQPSSFPSIKPTSEPTSPSGQPTSGPTSPSGQPTSGPTSPSGQPTSGPTSPTTVPTSLPTCFPTSSPSGEPTKVPILRPSSEPSTQPTTVPTSTPSFLPTSVPTRFPVSSKPTFIGDSNKPTTVPTSVPTLYYDGYERRQIYDDYVALTKSLRGNNDNENLIFYKTYNYKGLSIEGSCNDWNNFRYGGIILPFKNTYFSSIHTQFGYKDYVSRKGELLSASCEDADIISNILYAFNNDKNYQASCVDKNTNIAQNWRVFYCKNEGYSTMCVNCLDGCKSCMGGEDDNEFIINSCRTPSLCESTSSSYGVLKLNVTEIDMFPVININSMNSTSNSIEIHGNLSIPGTVYCAAVHPSEVLLYQSQFDVRQFGIASVVLGVDDSHAINNNIYSFNLTITDLLPLVDYKIYCYSEDFTGQMMDWSTVLSTNTFSQSTLGKPIMKFIKVHDKISIFHEPDMEDDYLAWDDSSSSQMFVELEQFEFEVEAPPIDTVLHVNVIDCNNVVDANTDPLPQPSSFSLKASSNSDSNKLYTHVFSFKATKVTCYRYSITAHSGYSYDTINGKFFTTDQIIVQPVPTIIMNSSYISNDGLKILITFDSRTDKGRKGASLFTCTDLITLPSGYNFNKCLWLSDTVLSIVLDPSLPVPDIVEVKGGHIRSKCNDYLTDDECHGMNTVVTSPLMILPAINPITPVVSLSLPSQVAKCNDIDVDPTQSYGNGGQPWKNITWYVTYTSSSISSNYNASHVVNYLNMNHGDSIASIITIPNSILTIGTYQITLQLINFMGKSLGTTMEVKVLDDIIVPRVNILGPQQLTRYRWQSIRLFVAADIAKCSISSPNPSSSNSNSTNTEVDEDSLLLSYTWKLYQGLKYKGEIRSVSGDPRVFAIAPYTLESGVKYTLNVLVKVVSDNSNAPRSSSAVTILINRSGVVAHLKGGLERTVSATEEVLMDASLSYDLDYPDADNDDTSSGSSRFGNTISVGSLSYTWSCIKVTPVYGDRCGSFFREDWGAIGAIGPGAWRDAQGRGEGKYQFTVIVTNTSTGMKATARSILSVTRVAVPLAEISPMFGKINIDSKFILNATMDGPRGTIEANWSVIELSSDELSSYSLSPIQHILPSGKTTVQLALSPNSLASGTTYSFTIRTRYISPVNIKTPVSNEISTTSMIITTNEPPSRGSLVVSPSNGTALETLFSLSTFGWIDDPNDFPLMFIFTSHSFDPKAETLLMSKSEKSYVQAILTEGLPAMDPPYKVTISVRAFDVLNSSTYINAVTRVKPFQDSANNAYKNVSEINKVFNSLFEKGNKSYNLELISQALGATTRSMNTLDCDGITLFECSSLRRYPCADTAKTCGTCLPGYVGVAGDAMSPCLLKIALFPDNNNRRNRRRMQQGNGQLEGVAGASCTRHTECLSGVCQALDATSNNINNNNQNNKVCTQGFKTCPLDCGGTSLLNMKLNISGACIASRRDQQRIVFDNTTINLPSSLYPNTTTLDYSNFPNACPLEDSSCFMMCQCFNGSYGSDCSYNATSYHHSLILRHSLCSGLYDSLIYQDVDNHVFNTRANLVAQMLRDPTLIRNDSALLCSKVLLSHILDHPEVAGNEASIELAITALSRVLNVQHMFYDEQIRDEMTLASKQLALYRQLSLAVGEEGESISSDNLRISSSKLLALDITNGHSFQVGHSDFETYYRIPISEMYIDMTAVDNNDIVGITSVEYRNRTNDGSTIGDTSNSSKVLVQALLYSTEDDSAAASAYATPSVKVVTTLHNFQSQNDYSSVSPQEGRLWCQLSDSRYNATYNECPEPLSLIRSSGVLPGDTVPLHYECPGDGDGWFNVTCPYTTRLPFCMTRDPYDRRGDNNDVFTVAMGYRNAACKLVSYTHSETTCECDMSKVLTPTRRILSSGYDLSSISATRFEIEVTSSAYNTDYGAKVAYNERCTEPVIYNDTILNTLYGFIVTFIIGLVLFFISDVDSLKTMARTDFNASKKRTSVDFFSTILPSEFTDHSVLERLWTKLMDEHSILRLFQSYDESNILPATFKWICGIGRMLGILSLHLYLNNNYYADDGTCENNRSSDTCLSSKSMDGTEDLCSWHEAGACCNLREPTSAAIWIMQTTALVATSSVIINTIFETISQHASKYIMQCRKYDPKAMGVNFDKQAGDDSNIEEFAMKNNNSGTTWEYDELEEVQTYRGTLYRAARLARMQNEFDYTSIDDELDFLIQDVRNQKAFDILLNGGYPSICAKKLTEEEEEAKSQLFIPVTNISQMGLKKLHQLRNKLIKHRKEARTLSHDLVIGNNSARVEKILTRVYLSNMHHQWHQRQIAHHFLVYRPAVKDFHAQPIWTISFFIDVLLLFVLLLGMAYYVYTFNDSIGAKGSSMWLNAVLTSVVLDLFFFQPIRIYVTFLTAVGYIREEVVRVTNMFKTQGPVILRRAEGLVREYNCLSQHFNPACRAARSFPALPVARILLSLSDFEFKATISDKRITFLDRMNTRTATVSAVLVMVVLQIIPISFHSFIVDVLFTSFWSIFLLFFIMSFTNNALLTILGFLGLFFLTVAADVINTITSNYIDMQANIESKKEKAKEADQGAVQFHKKLLSKDGIDKERADKSLINGKSNDEGIDSTLSLSSSHAYGVGDVSSRIIQRRIHVVGSPIGEIPSNRREGKAQSSINNTTPNDIPDPAFGSNMQFERQDHSVGWTDIEEKANDINSSVGVGSATQVTLIGESSSIPIATAPLENNNSKLTIKPLNNDTKKHTGISMRSKRKLIRANRASPNDPESTTMMQLVQKFGLHKLLRLGVFGHQENPVVPTVTDLDPQPKENIDIERGRQGGGRIHNRDDDYGDDDDDDDDDYYSDDSEYSDGDRRRNRNRNSNRDRARGRYRDVITRNKDGGRRYPRHRR